MTALEYILDGLEAELALERELGVRSFEMDRTLLAPMAVAPRTVPDDKRHAIADKRDAVRSAPAPTPTNVSHSPAPTPTNVSHSPTPAYPFVFLHEKALSPAGVEMMAKIITAMGKTAETAPIVIVPPLPKAKVYIVLGGLALRKWFPGVNAAPGQWLKTEEGQELLVSNSPEYILRFKTVTPAVKKIKQDMWTSLKSVLKKV